MRQDIQTKLDRVAIRLPKIILPKDEIDLTKWAVVAVDQYTSEPEYWKKVDESVGGEPSTLRIVLPEVYLEAEDKQERIARINETMKRYLEEGALEEKFEGMVLVDRATKKAPSRKGLIVALDLEKYDYTKGSKSLIRATEGTVIERIPPRLEIRRNAPMELPHIMVLINDPQKSVIEPLFEENLEKIYDFELMMEGGQIKGYKVEREDLVEKVAEALEKLISQDGFLYAMGDGNHSMATAKAHWEEVKRNLSEEEKETHPARYCMVELVNVHDDGLKFEPIHRVVFGAGEDLLEFLGTVNQEGRGVGFIRNGEKGYVELKEQSSYLPVGNLQKSLDEYLKLNLNTKIDYVHDENTVESLGRQEGNFGFFLPAMKKEELFPTVEKDGALPRKTFSMGESTEKRYYLEGRKISK